MPPQILFIISAAAICAASDLILIPANIHKAQGKTKRFICVFNAAVILITAGFTAFALISGSISRAEAEKQGYKQCTGMYYLEEADGYYILYIRGQQMGGTYIPTTYYAVPKGGREFIPLTRSVHTWEPTWESKTPYTELPVIYVDGYECHLDEEIARILPDFGMIAENMILAAAPLLFVFNICGLFVILSENKRNGY